MTILSRRGMAALAAFFAVVLAVLVAVPAHAQDKPKIKVSSLTLPVFNPLVWNIMKAQGFDAKQGFELDIHAYPSIAAFYAGFATGETDALIGGPTVFQKLYQEGVPVRIVGTGFTLADLSAHAVDEMVRVAGPGAASPLLVVELGHIGGEMSRARPGNGALAAVTAPYLMVAGGTAPTGQAAAAVAAHVQIVKSAMSGWAAPQTYLNLTETQADPARFWSPQAYDRLRRIKATADPANLIRANHPVPPEAPRSWHPHGNTDARPRA